MGLTGFVQINNGIMTRTGESNVKPVIVGPLRKTVSGCIRRERDTHRGGMIRLSK
jgi:hypothetical protein